MLFRATRGNCYVRFAEIEEALVDSNGEEVIKVAFVIFFKSKSIEMKVRRICDAFSAHCFDMPHMDSPREIDAQQESNYRCVCCFAAYRVHPCTAAG